MTNLRRDIHSAFEVITPPLGGMPERVVQTVLAEKKGRLRKERMVFRLRVSLALVAAVVIAAVGVAAVITWNSLHNNVSPAGQVAPVTLQQLEARTLRLPAAKSANACPDNPGTNKLGYQFGSGPVYVDGGPEISTDWGYYYDVTYYAPQSLKGPLLVRGRDLTTPDRGVVFVGPFGSGTVIGVEPNMGQRKSELVLDPSHPPSVTRANVGASQMGNWHVRQGISKGWAGCVGFQIDGADFTEIITALTPP